MMGLIEIINLIFICLVGGGGCPMTDDTGGPDTHGHQYY